MRYSHSHNDYGPFFERLKTVFQVWIVSKRWEQNSNRCISDPELKLELFVLVGCKKSIIMHKWESVTVDRMVCMLIAYVYICASYACMPVWGHVHTHNKNHTYKYPRNPPSFSHDKWVPWVHIFSPRGLREIWLHRLKLNKPPALVFILPLTRFWCRFRCLFAKRSHSISEKIKEIGPLPQSKMSS